MRPARVFVVPYDSGQRAVRMGAGPLRLATEIENATFEMIESSRAFQNEIGTSFELYGKLAEAIRITTKEGELPVVLTGNCGASVGTAAGVGPDNLALIWFDAHGDLMTPESTVTGFLDGIAENGITLVGAEPIRDRGIAPVTERLDAIAKVAKRIVIHVDMDVIDPESGRANHFAAPGGLTPDHIRSIIEHCRTRFEIAALVIASFDRAGDDRGTLAAAARSFADAARAS